MKSNIKNIGLILVIILLIAVLAACTPQDAPQDNEIKVEDLILATGYSRSLTEENGKNFIEFTVAGEDLKGEFLKLEVVDEDLFNSVEENEFYIYSYNEDYLLRNVQRDFYLKGLVEDSIDDDDNNSFQEILAENIISIDGLTLLDQYIIDFNDDGYEEIISMYVTAGRDSNGEIMWDDGQRWLLIVHGDNKDYLLYDDYVQLGSIQFNVFTEDDDFYIVTKSVRTASLTVSQYIYDKDDDSFKLTIDRKSVV